MEAEYTVCGPHELLDRLVRGAERSASVDALVRYFTDKSTPDWPISGRRFERFAGGGDAPEVRHRVTPADVLAVSFLDTRDNLAAWALDVLEVHHAEINSLLAEVPCAAMYEVGFRVLDEGSAARQLSELLRACGGGNRWVMAAKLLARKRPHLLPVIDKRVRNILGGVNDVWRCLWTWFHDDPDRVAAVAQVRSETGDIDDVSLLRCLHVLLWLRKPPPPTRTP
jgi:hypothetical protein